MSKLLLTLALAMEARADSLLAAHGPSAEVAKLYAEARKRAEQAGAHVVAEYLAERAHTVRTML